MKQNINNKNSGFSVVELLIVFVVVGLIGGIGFFVYQRSNSQQSNKAAEAESRAARKSTAVGTGRESGTEGLIISDGAADQPTSAQLQAWNKKCQDEFIERNRKGQANTGTKNCLDPLKDAFYKKNKYKYAPIMTAAGITLKACRVSNDPQKPVKVKTFIDWTAAKAHIKEQERKYGVAAITLPGGVVNREVTTLNYWLERYAQTITASLYYDQGKFRPIKNGSGNTKHASKEMYYITGNKHTPGRRNPTRESNVSIWTAQFSGYYGQYNGNNKNPTARFSIWGEDKYGPVQNIDAVKNIKFLSLPKC